ncbi:histone-fold-containing protein [Cylindrobasidium torrendii FP15055 ss-10]|uniref:Histone-fold-containing protein n=1 Tax=Cylindrobasidium torrendii FP15055 ss-10 TaxID=1314674 RepID=A0A0D7B6N6_9AGAR|nr:histone-fold-containing protein [Cylindrobasidium torrendii FP15055 ss-10]
MSHPYHQHQPSTSSTTSSRGYPPSPPQPVPLQSSGGSGSSGSSIQTTQSEPFVQTGTQLNEFLRTFWQRQIDMAERETLDVKHPALPLARIKKVMKSDPDVKMIAADAPILFCKACEIFIAEITARAFIVADSNKRRTLSRSDIAKALTKSDQFDFLIDIVPRDANPTPAMPNALSMGPQRVVVKEEVREPDLVPALPPIPQMLQMDPMRSQMDPMRSSMDPMRPQMYEEMEYNPYSGMYQQHMR